MDTANSANTCKGNYNVVNLILNKGLHTESDECMTYTTNLMDKLELFKADNVGNDAVHDDMAAQAYVEQFATETFQRADKALRAKRATK
jgi:vacuolar protein sorting-associated protein VTA1